MKPESARRVVITGIGVISPLGNTQSALWEAFQSGRSGVGTLKSVPTDYLPTAVAAEATHFTGEIDNFGPLDKEQKKAVKKALKV
ncbi:MAG: beta-ketoacyl synthase N-terminal-like domain-containing protein, partial [Planctomycetota bacterium]|nr:beta-ketoacyl synthase N-terminal-like domain-containing protein [Planctomycetota bacterium]